MSQSVGRNDLCPCGSGAKMKNCHPKGYGTPSKHRIVFLVAGGIAALVIVVAVAMTGNQPSPQQRPPAPVGTPANNPASGGTPQPDGPVPEGKVWSTEHGHWHNAPGTPGTPSPSGQTPGQTPAQTTRPLTPQPDGPVPEGKVWSAEHGHWHNAPAAVPSPVPSSAQPTETGP